MAAKDDALKRLGGGRWQTRDERFTIEPQGGSWVVVDAQQTDDLGLPLVRGPFSSLTAAKAAIETARQDEAPVSPLAERIEAAGENPRPPRERPTPARRRTSPATPPRTALPAPGPETAPSPEPEPAPAPKPEPEPPKPPPPPPPPPEPVWIGRLKPAARTAARALIERLEAAGVEDAADVARAELVDGEPAVARLALERAVGRLVGDDDRALVDRLLPLLTDGRDDALGVRWRLTDGDGRPIGPIRSGDEA